MSSIFRNKTIKFERREASKKKSGLYDVIGTKHNEIMSNMKTRKSGLIKMKQDLNKITIEIENLSDPDKCNKIIKELEIEISMLKNDIPEEEVLVIPVPKKTTKRTKKTKKVVQIPTIQVGVEVDTSSLKIQEKIFELEVKFEALKYIFSRNCYINSLKDRKRILSTEIYELENNVEELDYFEKNLDILEAHCSNNQQQSNVEEISILDLFNNESLFKESNVEKNQLVDKYLQSINGNRRIKKINLGKICKRCNVPKLLNSQESTFTCEKCGEVEYILMDSDKPAYNSSSEPKTNSYRRINHCSEILNQSQGKESTEIEQELMDKIIVELKILGITDLTLVTKQHIKIVLKTLGESAKAEHAVFIANKLNGIAVQTIPHELIEIVKAMWTMIEDAWYIYKSPERRNFMNSSYVFHKIFELLDEPEEAMKWPYLADDKLKPYDVLWASICRHWGWRFIPSIQ